MINELKTMYEEYAKKAYEVRKKAPVFAGWLGLGNDPRRHPCHEEFYESTITWTDKFVATEPTAQQAMEVATFVLEMPVQYREYDAYWFMWVAVGNLRAMIPVLTKEDCRTLVKRFDELYKKKERMPLQVETYKKLVKAAK